MRQQAHANAVTHPRRPDGVPEVAAPEERPPAFL